MGEAVRDTVDSCERLIESLLVLARSEAAAGREEPVDVAALVGDCITDLRARAQDARIEVSTALDPAWTCGEPGLLERMTANLVDNGLRHNQRGGYLKVSTHVVDRQVRLGVRNGGAVIDPAQAQTLTEPFRRLDRARDGFGLGLSIVRSVARAHGGTIEVLAPENGGLEVTVALPAFSSTAAAILPTVAPTKANVVVARTPDALTKS